MPEWGINLGARGPGSGVFHSPQFVEPWILRPPQGNPKILEPPLSETQQRPLWAPQRSQRAGQSPQGPAPAGRALRPQPSTAPPLGTRGRSPGGRKTGRASPVRLPTLPLPQAHLHQHRVLSPRGASRSYLYPGSCRGQAAARAAQSGGRRRAGGGACGIHGTLGAGPVWPHTSLMERGGTYERPGGIPATGSQE